MIPIDFNTSTLGGKDRDFTVFEAWKDSTNGILTRGEAVDIYCSEVGTLDVVLKGAATAPDYYRLIRLIGDPKDINITINEKNSRVEVDQSYPADRYAFCALEPSGCTVRKNRIQIRYDFYLKATDARYAERNILLPVVPEKAPVPKTEEDEAAWVASLPKQFLNTPFHTHFAYFDPGIDLGVVVAEIVATGNKFLFEAYEYWKKKEFPALKNPVKPAVTVDKTALCAERLAQIVGAV